MTAHEKAQIKLMGLLEEASEAAENAGEGVLADTLGDLEILWSLGLIDRARAKLRGLADEARQAAREGASGGE